ncbi:MAG TPA: ATP-dependent helicase [Flavobacteriales bacterium]|jgi:ATP-dependent RNA helicase RhlE|nr:ATP-dependent helicase [Flavobacteriales bacterium]
MNSTYKNKNQRGFGKSKNHRGRKKKFKQEGINPKMFVNRASGTSKSGSPVVHRKFSELRLDRKLLNNIAKKDYEFMTEIQDRSFDGLLQGRDLLGIARTGTGKTASFAIPMLQKIAEQPSKNQTLILAPTRELAVQVQEEIHSLSYGMRIFSISLIGGSSVDRDVHKLKRHHHIFVGTPGRINDLIKRRALNLSKTSMLVLDEFDRMLDMGFRDEVMGIISQMKARQQTMLFSATEDDKLKKYIQELLHQPEMIRVSSGSTPSESVDQDVVRISKNENKFEVFTELLRSNAAEKILVFDETKRGVSRLANKMKKSGFRVDEIHGDKSQAYRSKALEKFKKGKINVLVATDVAARGIDVDDISHVINYQAPRTMDSYIHRVGRTGRAGKTGKAFTLVDVF